MSCLFLVLSISFALLIFFENELGVFGERKDTGF